MVNFFQTTVHQIMTANTILQKEFTEMIVSEQTFIQISKESNIINCKFLRSNIIARFI